MSGSLLPDDITQDVKFFNVPILNTQALSAAIDLKAHRAVMLFTPAAMDLGDISFQVSYDNGAAYTNLYDNNGEVKIPTAVVAVSRALILDLPTFIGVRYLKIRTGLAAAPVNQGADRTLVIGAIPR